MEILEKLGINSKILLAQIVNFFLLLYILKRFLYQPLLDIISKREKKIKEGLEKSEQAAIYLEKVQKESEEKLLRAGEKADKILEDAHKEGEEHKADLLRQAKDEINKWKEDASLHLKKEKEKLVAEAQKEVGELVIQIASKIIPDKVDDGNKDKWLQEVKEQISKVEKSHSANDNQ